MRILILCCALGLGFFAGRLCAPSNAKAAIGSHIVHVSVAAAPYSNEARLPYSITGGNPIAISCTESGNGRADCFVLMQGD